MRGVWEMTKQDELAAEEYARVLRERYARTSERLGWDNIEDAVIAGIEHERTRAAELIGDLEHILENASSLDGELSIGHEGAMCLKVALTRFRGTP
jgi:hypothetical protein